MGTVVSVVVVVGLIVYALLVVSMGYDAGKALAEHNKKKE